MKGSEDLEGPARYFEFWHSVTAKGLQLGDRESRDTVYMNSMNVTVTAHLKGGDLFPNGEASGSSEGLLVSGIVYTEVETGVKDASCNDFM